METKDLIDEKGLTDTACQCANAMIESWTNGYKRGHDDGAKLCKTKQTGMLWLGLAGAVSCVAVYIYKKYVDLKEKHEEKTEE